MCQALVVTKQAEGRDSSRERERPQSTQGHPWARPSLLQDKGVQEGSQPSKVKGTEGCPSSGSRGRASQVTSPCSAHHPHSHRYPVLQTRIGGSEEERSLSRAA